MYQIVLGIDVTLCPNYTNLIYQIEIISAQSYSRRMFKTSSSFQKRSHLQSELKSAHKICEKDNFNSLFFNKKMVLKKKDLVDFVKTKSGQNKKYSNAKAYNSIPLLNNIKRLLSVDVVRETKNNKYDLIIKTCNNRKEMQRAKSNNYYKGSLNFQNQQLQKYPSQYSKRRISTGKRKQVLEEQYYDKRLMTSDRFRKSDQSRIQQFLDSKVHSRYQVFRNKKDYIDTTNVYTSGGNTSPSKLRSKSQFLVEGANLISSTSPVWIINDFA